MVQIQQRPADKVRTYIRRQKIGVVYQFHNLLSEFNVWENVAYPLWLQGIHRKTAHTQVLSLLSDVGMLDKADAKTRTLSGGASPAGGNRPLSCGQSQYYFSR